MKRIFCRVWHRKCCGVSEEVIAYTAGGRHVRRALHYKFVRTTLVMPLPHRAEALSDDACLTSDRLSVAYIGFSKSKTERLRIGTEVAHATRDLDNTFKVERSKVDLQGAGAYCGSIPHSLYVKQWFKRRSALLLSRGCFLHVERNPIDTRRFSYTPTAGMQTGI